MTTNTGLVLYTMDTHNKGSMNREFMVCIFYHRPIVIDRYIIKEDMDVMGSHKNNLFFSIKGTGET